MISELSSYVQDNFIGLIVFIVYVFISYVIFLSKNVDSKRKKYLFYNIGSWFALYSLFSFLQGFLDYYPKIKLILAPTMIVLIVLYFPFCIIGSLRLIDLVRKNKEK